MNSVPAPSRALCSNFDASLSADEEETFFASLHQCDGTTRMTSSGRLDDVNTAVANHLPVVSQLAALDVGISSGISTVEWLLSLERLGHACAMTGIDRILHARLFRVGQLQVLTERDGYALLIHNGRRGFTRPAHRTASWRNIVARTAFWASDTAARFGGAVGAGRQVQLVSRHLRLRSDVQLIERNLFSAAPEWARRFHVVRVANLLNRCYFSEAILRVGIRNAGSWVQLGGLLAVARTGTEGQNNATLFRREITGLRAIHRLGSGSEIETLVTSVLL